MEKGQFAVMGHPIIHTISPFIHNRLFEIAKVRAEYKIIDVKPENLARFISFLRELDGYNVTIPHKFNIIKFLDKISEKSKMYKSVNTVKNTKFSAGYTTDAGGFLRAMEYENFKVEGRALVAGTGGVASVIAHELATKGCNVVIAARVTSFEKAEKLACSIKKNIQSANVSACPIQGISGKIDLFVNATPVGMYPHKDEVVVGNKILTNCRQVYDTVYNPYQTRLVKQAKAFGIKATSGLSMLVFQAVLAHKIWHEFEYSDGEINQLICDCFAKIDKEFN